MPDLARRMEARILEIPGRLRANVVAAATILDDSVKRTLGTPGTPASPAPPGSPPHRVSGALQSGSRAVAANDGTAVSIITTPIGIYQDKGTSRMRARPWAAAALAACYPRFRAALLDFSRRR
jgi:hypothetical protein